MTSLCVFLVDNFYFAFLYSLLYIKYPKNAATIITIAFSVGPVFGTTGIAGVPDPHEIVFSCTV
jgi:hypothetical protein